MNEFSEKTFVATNWRKQPKNAGSSGTHKKEKWHLFLQENEHRVLQVNGHHVFRTAPQTRDRVGGGFRGQLCRSGSSACRRRGAGRGACSP